MEKRPQYAYTVSVMAWAQGGGAVLDWTVYRARVGDGVRKPWKHRRVLIRDTGPLSVPQLTTLTRQMAAYVLVGQAGQHLVQKGRPWREPGRTDWSVPPGGGEGGARRTPPQRDRTGREYPQLLTEGLIP